jgi:hypothetical protein
MNRWVTVKRAAELTGYTVDAIQKKISKSVWPEGLLWRNAPDGRRLINLEVFDKWVENRLKLSV